MSIYELINYWIKQGALFQVTPTLDSDPLERQMFASEDVNRLITGPWIDERQEIRAGRLWADLDRFVVGRLITVSLDTPYTKPKSTYLARMDPGGD